jgi:transcription-repair coupling factor (superfamily II helicase)
VIVTTLSALAQKTIPPEEFAEHKIELHVGREYDLEQVIRELDDLGYQRGPKVEEEGFWALRGGIIDIFPPGDSDPLRLEFLGDELKSIRTFSAENQRAKREIDSVSVFPASEIVTPGKLRKDQVQKLFNCLVAQKISNADRDGMMSAFGQGLRFTGFDMFAPILRRGNGDFFGYVSGSATLIFPKSIDSCRKQFAEAFEQLQTTCAADMAAERPTVAPELHFLSPLELDSSLAGHYQKFEFGNPFHSSAWDAIRLEGQVARPTAPSAATGERDRFSKWIPLIRAIRHDEHGSIAILARSKENCERILSLLHHHRIAADISNDLFAEIATGKFSKHGIFVGRGYFGQHLWLGESQLLVLGEDDLFGQVRRKKKSAPSRLRNYLSSFKDLKVNDLVVHLTHGIGRYLGMKSLVVAGGASDYLIIEYANTDKIYLPVEKLNMLQRYSSSVDGDRSSALDKLGSPSWAKRKAKVKQAIAEMADKLLKIQAKRHLARAHTYGDPGETFHKFEDDFPYQETDDQLRVLNDVEADFRSDKLMDRLVVGDVGFGKTEIALRAALRCVLEGFQVLVLVPTTVLCYQHYQTFRQRLAKYGVQVGQLNRFVKGNELKATLAGIHSGFIDIAIGTHRLLSKDIAPKKLGMLVVDEEQRFGVAHKERIKEMRASADVLTLTATPIPRTLHMAMVGLRQISVIASPPEDRLPVKTYVSKFDKELIREAINHELSRSGQVFFVYNRVEDIGEVVDFVRKLVPNVEVRFAHGQMGENELERVILDFIEHKFSILVCTTIIESGIDMPNVNTLIVLRADMFGLAQLYQLRGRVGRSNVQAYAYFFTPEAEKINEDAAKRLEVLAANQDLGSGFQIASHDMEIRGAGNLLGAEQSGQVNSVGIELYTEMLEEVIRKLRGEEIHEKQEIDLKLGIPSVIPVDYVANERDRLNIYKAIFSAESRAELDDYRDSLEDQFGPLPQAMVRLFKIAEVRRILRAINAIHLIQGAGRYFEVKFGALSEKQLANMIGIVEEQPEHFQLLKDYRLLLSVPPARATASPQQQDAVVDGLLDLLEPLLNRIEV